MSLYKCKYIYTLSQELIVVCIYMYICTCIYICKYIHMSLYICKEIYTVSQELTVTSNWYVFHVFVRVRVFVYKCVCVCVCGWLRCFGGVDCDS